MTLRIIPAIHLAAHAVGLSIAQAPGLDVSQAEAHVLSHLADRGEATIGEIHRAFGHKRSTLTSVLDRLEGRQLITREVSPGDRRSFVVTLTRQGRSVAARVLAHLQALETEVRREVSRSDLDAFERIMERVVAAVDRLAGGRV